MNAPTSDAMLPIAAPSGRGRDAGALAVLLVVLAGVFALGIHWSEAGFFHRHFDQVSYRLEAVRVASALDAGGLFAGLEAAWRHATAQGVAYPWLGGLAYWAGVDPRSVIAGWWACCLGLTFVAVRSAAGGRRGAAWIHLGLMAAATTHLNAVGSARDFRPDFCAQFLWTSVAATGLASRGFSRMGWSLAFGAVLGVAFVSRSLTFFYAAAATPAWLLAAWLGDADGRGRRSARLGRLAAAGLVAIAVAAPFAYSHHELVRAYYFDNHISTKENAARGFGYESFWRQLGFYVRSLRKDHLGYPALALLVAALTGTLLAAGGPLRAWRGARASALVWLGSLAPLGVLAMGPQRSSTVSGVVAGAFLLLGVLPACARGAARPPRRLWLGIAVVGLALWPARFLWSTWHDGAGRSAAGHAGVAVQHAAALAHTAGSSRVVVVTLPLIEAHSRSMLEVVGYERDARMPGRFVDNGLGHSIYRTSSEDEFAAKLREADVVFWWDGQRSGGDLPSNLEVEERRELIERILASDFELAPGPAASQPLEGSPVRLYFRRD